jgi:hypothetical protein
LLQIYSGIIDRNRSGILMNRPVTVWHLVIVFIQTAAFLLNRQRFDGRRLANSAKKCLTG